jgi:cell division topological specificity factor
MKLLDIFARRRSARVARERLQILLTHERSAGSQSDLIPILREEVLAVVAKHVTVDPDKVQVKLDRGEAVSILEINIEVPRGTENRGTENRGKKPQEPEGDVRVSEPPARLKQDPGKISRFAYEVDPGGVLEQAHSKVGGLEGAAMMLYDKQVENMYADAWRDAERAFDRDTQLHNQIFSERQSGEWVLVQVNLLETDAPDAQGNRHVMFWNVEHRAAAPGSVTTPDGRIVQVSPDLWPSREEFRDYMVERLKNVRMPARVSEQRERLEPRSMPRGWHVKSQDYSLLPPFDQSPRTSPADQQRSVDTIRGTWAAAPSSPECLAIG